MVRVLHLSITAAVFGASMLAACAVLLLRMRSFRFTVDPIERYFAAMNGAIHEYADTVYPTTPALQHAIHKHQSQCGGARFLEYELYVPRAYNARTNWSMKNWRFIRWNNGLGSDYLGATTALALAISSGRILILREPRVSYGWLHSYGCAQRGPVCFFQKVTSCVPPRDASRAIMHGNTTSPPRSTATVLEARASPPYLRPARAELHTFLPSVYSSLCVAAPRARGSTRPPPSRARARVLHLYAERRAWHTQAALYLLRLNSQTQLAARVALFSCGHGGADVVGAPVRASDKCVQAGREMSCVNASAVATSIARIRAAQPWLYTALVTSENANAAAAVSHALQADGWIVRINAADIQQGSGSRGAARIGGAPYEATLSAITSLTCQIMPQVHVLTMRSNFHSLVDMLAKVVPGKTSHFTYSVGDQWHPL